MKTLDNRFYIKVMQLEIGLLITEMEIKNRPNPGLLRLQFL